MTKLPFLVDERHLAFQVFTNHLFKVFANFDFFFKTHVVTTTVIPSEPGEAGIPWWVWILAALGGILVLAAITYCLYKVAITSLIITRVTNVFCSVVSLNDVVPRGVPSPSL